MKKLLSIWIVFFILNCNSFADTVYSVKMRTSEKDKYLRIVFDCSKDVFIKYADVSSSYSLIKVNFPNDFTFESLQDSELIDVSKKDRSLYINIKDLKKIKIVRLVSPPRLVIDAFLSKTKEKTDLKNKKHAYSDIQLNSFMLDAGHGGHDPGIIESGFKESNITLSLVRLFADTLKDKKKIVYLTRRGDKYISIDKRISSANNNKPGLFLSFHLSNSSSFVLYTWNSPFYSVTSKIWYNTLYSQIRHKGNSEKLANAIGNASKKEFDISVIHRKMPVALLSSINSPAIIIELPGTNFIIYNSETYKRITEFILMGISEYEKG